MSVRLFNFFEKIRIHFALSSFILILLLAYSQAERGWLLYVYILIMIPSVRSNSSQLFHLSA